MFRVDAILANLHCFFSQEQKMTPGDVICSQFSSLFYVAAIELNYDSANLGSWFDMSKN